MTYTRTCVICGETFNTNFPRKITCSKKCGKENRRIASRRYMATVYEKKKKKTPKKINRTHSLCFECKRAYAKPFNEGGCPKILSGTPIYQRAIETVRDKNTAPYTVEIVLECNYFELDYSHERNMESVADG